MSKYILQRTLVACLVALTVTAIAFTLVQFAGDPVRALAGENASAEELENMRRSLGLDKPIHEQYITWLGNVISGDFGQSIYFRRSISEMILERLPATFQLGAMSIALALFVGIPLGIIAAIFQGGWVDRVALVVALVGQALPNFWFSLLLILFFGLYLGALPISGDSTFLHFVLPSIALGYYAMPAIMRLVRSEMIEVLGSDYIRTANSKGLPFSVVILRHALRNAILPVISLAAVQFGFLLGGSVIIERIFAINGVGALAWESITRADFPVVQALVLVIALAYVLLTLLADILNALIDPRVREV